MKRVMCYGDSNTYGHDPDRDGARMDADKRWTGVLARLLGADWQVIEEGLCGRTTALEDPTSPGCNGLTYLLPCLRSQSPLDWVVLMLGTNDLQRVHQTIPAHVAMNVERLARLVLDPATAPVTPRLLIVSPIEIGDVSVHPYFDPLFGESRAMSKQLGPMLQAVADRLGCAFLDAATVAQPSTTDGLHMNAANHAKLAQAILPILTEQA